MRPPSPYPAEHQRLHLTLYRQTMAIKGSQIIHLQDDNLYEDNILLYIVVFLIALSILLYACCFIPTNFFSAPNATNSSFSQDSPSSQPQGLDAATINSLPITIYHQTLTDSSEAKATAECSICLGVFEDGEKMKVLQSCRHSYHCECVDKWLITHSSCPMCRTSVQVDAPV